jgi:hypothetical protein
MVGGGGMLGGEVGGGMVGGGPIVGGEVSGGMVGGGPIVGAGKSGMLGNPKEGRVNPGMLGGVVWAPAGIRNPAAPTPIAANNTTRRFHACMPTSPL